MQLVGDRVLELRGGLRGVEIEEDRGVGVDVPNEALVRGLITTYTVARMRASAGR
jgi:hypothetical protein